MTDTFTPLHRCMSCVRNDAVVALYSDLELCLHCLKERISPISPGQKFEITVSVVECGYDEEEYGEG